jgi:murein DD-endopeptidase MepM/ murein hydrolase activator NlpD
MRDDISRLILIAVVAVAISQTILGARQPVANNLTIKEQTDHWVWPTNGVITDVFGTRRGGHKGIDIASVTGTPIYAVDDGVVSKSYYSSTYGNVVFIKHENHFETVYAHLKSRNVNEGMKVSQGHLIGTMGNTGDSSGVHLHFEIHQYEWTYDKHNAVDPILAFGEVEVGNTVVANTAKVLEASGSPKKGYIVRKGDTLFAIARKYNTTVENIKRYNHLSSDLIVPGQTLIFY